MRSASVLLVRAPLLRGDALPQVMIDGALAGLQICDNGLVQGLDKYDKMKFEWLEAAGSEMPRVITCLRGLGLLGGPGAHDDAGDACRVGTRAVDALAWLAGTGPGTYGGPGYWQYILSARTAIELKEWGERLVVRGEGNVSDVAMCLAERAHDRSGCLGQLVAMVVALVVAMLCVILR